MRILKVVAIILLLNATFVHAQKQVSPLSAGFDVGSGIGSNSWAPSIAYHEEIGTQKVPWLRIGLGFRVWGHYAGRTNLETERVAGVKDYLEYRDLSINGLSLMTGVTVAVWKFDFGVNTDLIGLAYGTKRHAYYEKATQTPGGGEAYYNQWLPTRPRLFNALPLAFWKNSGQSEAFFRFHATRTFGVKLGYLYGRTTYGTTSLNDRTVYLDNNQRYVCTTYGLPYVALAFSIGE